MFPEEVEAVIYIHQHKPARGHCFAYKVAVARLKGIYYVVARKRARGAAEHGSRHGAHHIVEKPAAANGNFYVLPPFLRICGKDGADGGFNL